MTETSVNVSRKFIEDFDYCMKFYEVTGKELEFEKERCGANMAEAERCYESVAARLRSINVSRGFD